MKTRKKTSPALITAALIAVIALGGLALRLIQQRTTVPILAHAIPLGDRALLVRDVRGEWRRLSLDGALGDVEPLGTRARPLAYDNDTLWIAAEGVQLAAYRLPGLAPVPAVAEAARAHEALARGVDPRGLTLDGALVVRGRDGREHRVGLDGRVDPARDGERVRTTPWDESRGGRGQALGATEVPPLDRAAAPPTLQLSALGFALPMVVMDWARGAPLALPDPQSYLVAHSEDASGNGNHRLTRVTPDGKVRWTARAEELVGATDLQGAEHRVLWVGLRDQHLVVLAQAWRVEASSDIKLAQSGQSGRARLVTIDPATGSVVARVELRRGPAS